MKKRVTGILLTMAMLVGALAGCGTPGMGMRPLDSEEVPFYFLKADNERTIKLYFADFDHEIPYIDSETARDLMEEIYHTVDLDDGFALELEIDGNKAVFTRENGAVMELDCKEDKLVFSDYDAFLMPSYSPTVIDILEHYGLIPCLEYVREMSYSRCGGEVSFDLKNYGIDLIKSGGVCCMPLQTFSDVLTSLSSYVNFYYSSQGVFANEYGSEENEAALMEKYRQTPVSDKRSGALAEFAYNELCMILDYCYGLKEQHGIDSFDGFFEETGLKEGFLSDDLAKTSKAAFDLTYLYLADRHSSYVSGAPGSTWKPWVTEEVILGKTVMDSVLYYNDFNEARNKAYPGGVPGYEEIGNTAYITFDNFIGLPAGADYYKEAPTAEATDTAGICLYAFSQITREGSPIENVVLDLSMNSGGDSTIASFVLSMFLGTASICLEDTLTGAYMNEAFRCDANLDGYFDANDNLKGYRLFCLTSPISFSCGNLVPSIFKDSGMVKTIGMTTTGGACIVMPLSTANGMSLNFSGNRRLCSISNGSLYDIDCGVEPDYAISSIDHFYDREALTEYINGIF